MNALSLMSMPVEMTRHMAATDAQLEAHAESPQPVGERLERNFALAVVLVAACAGVVFGLAA